MERNELAFKLIASNLKRLRIEKGLTKEELSELCTVDKSHLHRIESSKSKIGIDALIRVATALDVSISEFFKIPDTADTTFKVLSDSFYCKENAIIDSMRTQCIKEFVEKLYLLDARELEHMKKLIKKV